MKRKEKLNPRRRPATWEDVNRAFEDGVRSGVSSSTAIFLTVLVDKFAGGEHVIDVWKEICKLSEEVGEKRVTIADLRDVLEREYGIRC